MTSQANNPILWQEYTHQQRGISRIMRRWWYLGPAIIINMLLMIFMLLREPEFRTRELAIFCIWIVHIAVIIRAVAAGMNAISREHVGRTWDSLVLTGISARRILIGKWGAALQRVAPWLFSLGLLRLVMLPVFFYSVLSFYAADYAQCINYYSASSSYSYSAPPSTCDEPFVLGWVPWAAVLAVIASITLTILEVLACTMLGIACSAITRRGVLAAIVAFSIRFAPIAVFGAVTYHDLDIDKRLFVPSGPYAQNLSYEVLRYTPFALADGGTAPISRLMVPLIPWSYNPYTEFSTHADARWGIFLAILLLIMLLVGSYFAAWLTIRMNGALPENKKR